MPGTHENGSESRMDRLEGLMELVIEDHIRFSGEHKQLLAAQVSLTDHVDKLAGTLDTAIKELSVSQRHTEERLNALIAVSDDLVRRRPPQ
jgi:hypothetical protein